MSILNLGLQNVSLERLACETNVENILKRKNSMAEIRVTQNDMPNLKIREEWTESLEPVKRTIMNRFIRLSLKDEPIQVMEPVSDEEIDILKHHIREMFPTIDLNKLQKAHTNKVRSYEDWLEKHSKSSHYIFQLKKCSDENCCLPPKYPLPSWLPDPVLDESGNHYKPYSEVKGQETTEKDRPSLKPLKKTKQKKQNKVQEKPLESLDDDVAEDSETRQEASTEEDASRNNTNRYVEMPDSPPSLCTVQNARLLVECVECRKPRVVYSKLRLTERQQCSLARGLGEYDFTCGSPLLPPTNPLFKTVMSRSSLSCVSPIELAYYSSGLGNSDTCCYCCAGGRVHQEMLAKFKTVLPICDECLKDGKDIVTQRPYGK